jgi:hypothetical protein
MLLMCSMPQFGVFGVGLGWNAPLRQQLYKKSRKYERPGVDHSHFRDFLMVSARSAVGHELSAIDRRQALIK